MMRAAVIAALALLSPTLTGAEATALGVGYICSAEHRPPAPGPSRLVIVQGMGTGGFPIQTRNPDAQAWFDYGLKLYHAFYHEDAKAAFRRAEMLDPTCALCAWGEALSLGPTLNYTISPEQTAQGLAAADRAAVLAKGAGDRDRALIAALQARYKPSESGQSNELAYGRAMADLAGRYPRQDEIANLAAHALITPARAGDLSGVPEAMVLLERVLARRPDDTAAIHYYIHAAEFAGKPELALPYAMRLADLAPEASHLVHMGAHTLLHAGRYEEVAVLNARAMDVDGEYSAAMGERGPLGAPRYYLHNLMFGLTGAVMGGDRDLALKYAHNADVAFPAAYDAQRRQIAIARALIAYSRFAPDQALAFPEPPEDQLAVRIYRHYARGEAFAQMADAKGALAESEALAAMQSPSDQSGNATLIAIAVDVLQGRAAMLQGRFDAAAHAFDRAAGVQQAQFGKIFDPPPWWYPIRRSVAAAYLKAGRYADAAREVRASLAAWPGDGLALKVLSQAEAGLGLTGPAATDMAKARRAWSGDIDKVSIDTI